MMVKTFDERTPRRCLKRRPGIRMKKGIIRRLTAVAAAATCLLSLAACGANSATENPMALDGRYVCITGEKPFYRAELRIRMTEDGFRAAFFEQKTEEDELNCQGYLRGTGTVDPEKGYVLGFEPLLPENAATADPAASLPGESTPPGTTCTVIAYDDDTLTVDICRDGENLPLSGAYRRLTAEETDEEEPPAVPTVAAEDDPLCEVAFDSTLAAAVRAARGIPAGEMLTADTLLKVRELTVTDTPVTSLNGITHLENLKVLKITSGTVSDLSPLAGMPHLTQVTVKNCLVGTVPDFSACTRLTELRLSGNCITDLSPLAAATQITVLDVSNNRISSLLPIAALTQLTSLGIKGNAITDFAAVAANPALVAAIEKGSGCGYDDCLAAEMTAARAAQEIEAAAESELAREVAAYRYILNNADPAADADSADAAAHPAYGYRTLIEQAGKDSHYAQAFCLLCRHLGLEAFTCRGEDRVWAMVKVDGQYYHCDPFAGDGNDPWRYFNRSSASIIGLDGRDHDLLRYPVAPESMDPLDYCDEWVA